MTWDASWHVQHHQGWFGVIASTSVPGTGPDGVATFSLDLQNGYTVTCRWSTDIIKSRSGKEQRTSRNDRPKESYRGSIVLFGTAPASLRAQLARYAAQGQAFSLGLPHEEMSIRAAHSGTTIYVHDTSASDWMNPGQRCVVTRTDPVTEIRSSVDAVIQSTTSNSITLDVNPGTVGDIGGTVMPLMPVYLEPEQSFPRYPTEAEVWSIDARAAVFDFAGTGGTIQMSDYAPSLAGAVAQCRASGLDHKFLRLEQNIGYPVGGYISAETATQTTFRFRPVLTTLGDLATALQTSALFVLTGSYSAAQAIPSGGNVTLESGGESGQGPMGTGATVATYNGKPLWDRKLTNNGSISDSIQAMTEILDYGGKPQSVGFADEPDWGRAVSYTPELWASRDEWQWFKLFMATVVGRQKSFYLSTYRDDLPFVSKAANTITVEADVGAWWPDQRQHVEILETDGTTTRREVTAVVDNGDGTWTLTIGVTLASSSVERVSWLELVRFGSDEFAVEFSEYGWSIDTHAVAVQQ